MSGYKKEAKNWIRREREFVFLNKNIFCGNKMPTR
jgi:hypothetical protein